MVFGVSYSDDLDKAMALIHSEIEKQESTLSDPAPVVVVDTLGASSVDIICRVWVARADYFPVKWALTKAVKERFDGEGVSIPFPSRTIYSEKAA